MDEQAMEKAMERAMENVLQRKMGEFFIGREQHYRHHQFLEELIRWTDDCKLTVTRTITRCFVMAALVLALGGFVLWGMRHFRG